ncbi:MAG TPA: IclR family transcriptional regulator [Terriglobia bacterium]|nr:IclR family transcriptional regulator [Terriglobia bacterium]
MCAVRTQSVRSLERAMMILELLASSRTGLSLLELVQKTKMPRSSVHCLLVTLQRRGYLYHNDKTGRYMFGLQLFSLANMAVSGLKLREEAAPFLRSLVEKTQLTVHMAILEHGEAVLISKYEPPGIFRLATWIGKRMDLHCTSLGKALMAYLPSEEVSRIIEEHGLPRHNDNTICSKKRLKEEMERTTGRGYAVDDEEDELGLCCIGAPVFGFDNHVMASISIAGTTNQVTRENLRKLAEQVKQTAMAISQSLGHDPAALKAGTLNS